MIEMRRVRAGVQLGLAWGVAWAIGQAVFHSLTYWGLVRLEWSPPNESFLSIGFVAFVAVEFVAGFAAGSVFAALMGSAERHESLVSLTPTRGALWGALASAILSVFPAIVVANTISGLTSSVLLLIALRECLRFAAVGAICGAGTVLIARRADPPAFERIVARRKVAK